MTYNKKVDIWSLGCILHELCTSEKAFPSDFATLEFLHCKYSWRVKISLSHDDLNTKISNVICQCLSIDHILRPTAREMRNVIITTSSMIRNQFDDHEILKYDELLGLESTFSGLNINDEPNDYSNLTGERIFD